MAIRDARLANDYRALQKLCAFNEPVKIKILEKRGDPSEYYKLRLSNCKGVESVNSNTPRYRTEHILIISDFPQDYPDPGNLPTIRVESLLYHPNIYPEGAWKAPGTFCFEGSELSMINEPLDTLVKRVISMIQYENMRFGTPANSSARDWANSNKHLFPLSISSTTVISKPELKWR